MSSKIQKALRRAYEEQKAKGLINQHILAKKIGITQGTLSLYLNGKVSIKDEAVESICLALNTNWKDLAVDFEIITVKEPEKITKLKKEIDDLLKDGPEVTLRLVEHVIADAIAINNILSGKQNTLPFPGPSTLDEPPEIKEVYVPLWDYLAASPPDGSDPEFLGYWPVVHSHKKDTWRSVRLKGTSMEPNFMDGDLVMVDLAQEPHKGDLVVADIQGQGGTFKEYGGINLKTDKIYLLAYNKPEHKDIILPIDEVQIKAVYLETIHAKQKRR